MNRHPIVLLDDATRPRAPRFADITEAERRHGRRLALFHRLHAGELDRVRHTIAQVKTGAAPVADLRDAVAGLSMRRSLQTFGNLCGRVCQILTMHHTIEDTHIFPVVRAGADGLTPLVDRLSAEHRIIHALIEELMESAIAAATAPGTETFAAAKTAFLTLDRVVRSHFRYEETELEEVLGRLAVEI